MRAVLQDEAKRGQNGVLQKLFSSYDSDGDNMLDKNELRGIFRKLGSNIDEDEIPELFSSIDKNDSGTISIHEFVDYLLPPETEAEVEIVPPHSPKNLRQTILLRKHTFQNTNANLKDTLRLRKVFASHDSNGDGMLDINELRGMFCKLGNGIQETELEELFSSISQDDRGRVSFDAFVDYLFPLPMGAEAGIVLPQDRMSLRAMTLFEKTMTQNTNTTLKDMESMSEQDLKDFREAFDEFDTNKDGQIRKDELFNGLYNLGFQPNEEDLAAWFNEASSFGDAISFKDWCETMLRKFRLAQASEALLSTFKEFDFNGNGVIEKAEFVQTMKKCMLSTQDGQPESSVAEALLSLAAGMSEHDIEALFDQGDKNRDGKIDYAEFARNFALSQVDFLFSSSSIAGS
mmetsp:Transcript_97605/g.173840  ORF Transcript_97605/g.173840 Transcript_97605/m.173840 type:complete len:403 (+) Transcript_97605:63-1271(+)